MDKKKIIILGVVAAAAIGLYMWSKSKKSTAASTGSEATPASGAAPVAPLNAAIAKPATTPASYDETLITSWIGKMKANQEWYDAIVKKAGEAGRPIEEQLRMDAIYMIEKK